MPKFGVRGLRRTAAVAVGLFLVTAHLALAGPKDKGDAEDAVPSDPMKIVISLKKQHLYVYRGDKLITSSRVSTGKSGHRTPAGVFSVLQKRRWHRSNIYSNAPMPYMQRLTWSGIALHQGYVPRYPASHGCIRMPRSFARELFGRTSLGSHVVITQDEAKPELIEHPALLQPRPLELMTMDARKALNKWIEDRDTPQRLIPLPEKEGESDGELTAAVREEHEVTSAPVKALPQKSLSPREASLQLGDFEYDLQELALYAEKSDEPLRILVTHRENRARVKDIQRLLKRLGYDAGDVDGYRGRQTRSAIRDFEKAHGMEETGDLTDTVLKAIYDAAAEKPSPSGHIYVKQGSRRIFDAPIRISESEKPLGTHLLVVREFGAWDKQAGWVATTAGAGEGEDSLKTALDRIELGDDVRQRLEKLLTPGSSMIISDGGLGPEKGSKKDFIALAD